MNNLIDLVKTSGGYLIIIIFTGWVMFLMVLELLAGVKKKFPDIHTEPKVVFTETVPTSVLDEDGCTIIGGNVKVCPEFKGE